MSITDELREAIATLEVRHTHNDHDSIDFFYPSPSRRELAAIADRIDAEHEAALLNVHTDLMDASGWVRLPKDADGEYIHIGDVMVYADGNTCPMKVVALVPPSVFLTDDGPRYADMCRHKPTTVEDVLREFTDAIFEWAGKSGTVAEVGTWSDVAAEYAAKLQLREVDE